MCENVDKNIRKDERTTSKEGRNGKRGKELNDGGIVANKDGEVNKAADL